MVIRREICSKSGHVTTAHNLHAFVKVRCVRSLFAGKVLQQLQPGAIITTGDLVDAKTLYLQGRQYQEEWEVHNAQVIVCCTKLTLLSAGRIDVQHQGQVRCAGLYIPYSAAIQSSQRCRCIEVL